MSNRADADEIWQLYWSSKPDPRTGTPLYDFHAAEIASVYGFRSIRQMQEAVDLSAYERGGCDGCQRPVWFKTRTDRIGTWGDHGILVSARECSCCAAQRRYRDQAEVEYQQRRAQARHVTISGALSLTAAQVEEIDEMRGNRSRKWMIERLIRDALDIAWLNYPLEVRMSTNDASKAQSLRRQ